MKKIILFSILVVVVTISTLAQVPTRFTHSVTTDPTVQITHSNLESTSCTFTFTKNSECAYFSFCAFPTLEIAQWTGMFGLTIEQLVQSWGIRTDHDTTYTYTGWIPNTEYTVFALPFGTDSVAAQIVSTIVTTSSQGGVGEAQIAIEVSEITESSVRTICTPNEYTAYYHNGIVEQNYYNIYGEDSLVTFFSGDQVFYEIDDWVWLTLIPNTEYYVMAFGYNSNDERGAVSLYPFTTLSATNIAEFKQNTCAVFPNPNNGDFTIVSNNLPKSTLNVYSVNGNLVYSQLLIDNFNSISSKLPSGVYSIQIHSTLGSTIYTGKLIVK